MKNGTILIQCFQVTRLGALFTLGSFFIFTQVPHFFGDYFFTGKRDLLISAKNGLGYILGDFFTSSSRANPTAFEFTATTPEL
jgi:hypothetical protein